ncbi:MAG TPA: IS110 family transposase [Desulfobacterales bacterium]|nr:IS110 family transposase [Desulfobacterales bacterium]
MELYAGLDLHSRNTYIGIMDKAFTRVFKKRVPNHLELILQTLAPFRDQIKGFVVESTYNWYWLVDGLMDAGYSSAHLANPSAIKQYEGLKHSDDQHDAFFLAQLLILGILPQGYIYPKKDRPVRDLARKRMFLVQHKTAHILSLQSLIQRSCAMKVTANDMRHLTVKELEAWLEEEYLVLSAQASLDSINFLKQNIQRLEKAIRKKVKLKKAFHCLKTVPGIGDILALTIMLEVGDINRFTKVGNFTSYCRCVPSRRLSDGKSKGHGNRKNGNRYLSWAFTEAAHLGRRHNERFRRYYNRKVAQANTSLATKALSNKLARICYFIIKDQVPFREKLFCQ